MNVMCMLSCESEIDCEGEDYNIIKGTKNLLKKNLIKLLKIEIQFEKNNFYEIINYLNRFNYKLISFTKVRKYPTLGSSCLISYPSSGMLIIGTQDSSTASFCAIDPAAGRGAKLGSVPRGASPLVAVRHSAEARDVPCATSAR